MFSSACFDLNILRLAVRECVLCSEKVNTPIKLLCLWLVLISSGKNFQSLFCLVTAITTIDDKVDCERPLDEGMLLETYLVRLDRLFGALPSPPVAQGRFTKEVLPEEILLTESMKFFADKGILDIYPTMKSIWMVFLQDGRRKMDGHSFQTPAYMELAMCANSAFHCLCLQCLGGCLEGYNSLVHQFSHDFLVSDMLADLKVDIDCGYLLFSEYELNQSGIDTAKILSSNDWAQIFTVPGVANWYESKLNALEQRWTVDKPVLSREIKKDLGTSLASFLTIHIIFKRHSKNLNNARAALEQHGCMTAP